MFAGKHISVIGQLPKQATRITSSRTGTTALLQQAFSSRRDQNAAGSAGEYGACMNAGSLLTCAPSALRLCSYGSLASAPSLPLRASVRPSECPLARLLMECMGRGFHRKATLSDRAAAALIKGMHRTPVSTANRTETVLRPASHRQAAARGQRALKKKRPRARRETVPWLAHGPNIRAAALRC